MASSRQLVAIMFTDIVGYTSLMGSDEQKAFDLLKKNRDIQVPIIEEFNGRFIKELGDGILACFPTASDALFAAMKIQQACSASKELSLRIGIHEGETTFENNDIFGDAVNIASRIQTLGVPGSILFSKKITDEVKNKVEFHPVSLGHFEFKHVVEPIEVFALANDGFPVPKRSMMDGKLKKKNVRKRNVVAVISVAVFIALAFLIYYDFIVKNESAEIIDKSIAVLPFTDMSAGKDQEYLGDGIANDIIATLSGIKDLKVIGRTSSFSFKNKNEDLHIIGEKLGAANILEGSVQKEGNKIRVTAQLIRAADGSILWSEKYDKDVEGIFNLQVAITGALVNQLKLKLLTPLVNTTPSASRTEAYTLLLQGDYYAEKRDRENLAKALDFYLKALALDSLNARAWASVAKCYSLQAQWWGSKDRNEGYEKARLASNKAIALDNNQAEGYRVLGGVKMFWDFNWSGAETEFQNAMKLEPGNADNLRTMGTLYRCTGRFEEAIRLTRQSITIDPVRAITYFNFGQLLYHAKHFEEAIESYKKVLDLNPQFPRAHIFLGMVYLSQGKSELALAEMPQETGEEAWRSFGLILVSEALGRKKEVDKLLSDFINKFPKDEAYQIAEIYAVCGEKDKAFEYLEKSYLAKEPRLTYFKGDPLLKNLEGDPRHKTFSKKMNFLVD